MCLVIDLLLAECDPGGYLIRDPHLGAAADELHDARLAELFPGKDDPCLGNEFDASARVGVELERFAAKVALIDCGSMGAW